MTKFSIFIVSLVLVGSGFCLKAREDFYDCNEPYDDFSTEIDGYFYGYEDLDTYPYGYSLPNGCSFSGNPCPGREEYYRFYPKEHSQCPRCSGECQNHPTDKGVD